MFFKVHLEDNSNHQVTGESVDNNKIPNLPDIQELPRVSDVWEVKDPEVEEDLDPVLWPLSFGFSEANP